MPGRSTNLGSSTNIMELSVGPLLVCAVVRPSEAVETPVAQSWRYTMHVWPLLACLAISQHHLLSVAQHDTFLGLFVYFV
jgi:hypothetical protein